jgi:ABC-type phosphate transport system substrate-binding protein
MSPVDFSSTDFLLNFWSGTCKPQSSSTSMTLPSDLDNFPDLVMLPSVAGAVVPVYNVKGVPANMTIVFGRKTLKDIFMGNIQVS